MAALDESMGFGFGAIGGGQEQSINLGAIDWSPPPKRSHSARQMPPPRARQMPPSIVVDISPADARAAELVRQANCAVATKIKIKPGTTKPLAAVYGKLRKRWRHVDGVLVLGAGPTQHSLKYAFVSPEHSCAPTEIIAPSPVSSLGSQSARKATPRRSPRPRKVTASGPQRPSDSSDDEDDDEEVRRLEAALAAAKAKKKRRRDGGSRSSSSLEMPRRSPRKHAGSTVPAPAPAPRLAMLAAASPPPRRSPRRQAAVEAALLGSDSSDGEEEVVESGAVASPPARKRQKNAENVSPASREEADLLRAALESPAGGALFAWNGGGPQSFQTPPSKDSSFRDDDEEASVPHRHRPGAPSPRRLAM
ncbi:unnamed protein product [Pelagomonas calceolata]|uniref:Uncharacterized protein n=2 Tax=Pelagomonas calceolata TaxID=35677 RepID=A0A8J2S7M6_9STRA|nr:unnamed protein product [Pelagomonas calceolata]